MQETYKIEKRDWAAKLMAIVVVVTMVTSTFVLFAPEASARTGSDSYGYSFKDSAESDGPTYAWTDIVSSGTKLLGSNTDGAKGPFDIGFDFEFYWYTEKDKIPHPHCSFYRVDTISGGLDFWDGEADTPAMAICTAAYNTLYESVQEV